MNKLCKILFVLIRPIWRCQKWFIL